MKFRHDGPSSMLDRVLGAIVAFIFVGLTMLLLPLYVAAYIYSHVFPVRFSRTLFEIYSSPLFYAWVGILSVGAIVLGVTHGALRMVELLAHMWGTEQPRNQRYTENIWGVTIIIAFVTFLVGFPWRRLLG